MSKHEDITDLVERIESLEERYGVTIEGLYASLSGPDSDGDYTIEINGELHSTKGLELEVEDNLILVAVAYDSQGRVLKTDETYFSQGSFHMFETFSSSFYVKRIEPTRIRLYPKES